MSSALTKILVADDHSVVRSGIIKSLHVYFPEALFGEASNASEIMQLIQAENWNLVILDIFMPGRNGLEVLKEIKILHPDIPVIIFSMYPEDQFAVRALKSGAAAYLTKDISSKELTHAIKIILNGDPYITPSLAELITKELRHDQDKFSHKTLSNREHQVFLLIARGKSVSTIADELSLSVKTISVYRANILKKMNLKNSSEIMHYAFKNNLVD
jgi:DNA-binding NarL/FixJ family response regulator